jgi:integrase
MAFQGADDASPTIVNSSVARTREYLTAAEIETLMAAARKSSRYGHRDATMILIAFRHGLRAGELCDLQWHQVELAAGRLHVRRNKRGTEECRVKGAAPMISNGNPPFDPKVFLSKVNGGRAVSDFRKDQIVYSQGEPADSVFYIQSGKVKKTVV